MEKYMSEASVFVPNSTSEASPVFSKLNERSELISISTKIDERKKLNKQSKLISISTEIDIWSEWVCTSLVRYHLPSSVFLLPSSVCCLPSTLCPLPSSVYVLKDLIWLTTIGMAKYTSEASVFLPNSTSKASPIVFFFETQRANWVDKY